MMTLAAARKLAESRFPRGPESLAQKLGISVRERAMSGCDGWVLSGPAGIVIRLNSNNSETRRRFTLAHELGHLLLGVPTLVGETVEDSLRSSSTEERRVNDLAAELLLPESIVRQQLSSVPVIASQLQRLAKKAKVSQLAAAIRVANAAQAIGLTNASVAFFRNDAFEWQWSKTLKMSATTAHALLANARDSAPEPARIHRKQSKDVIVASMIDNPWAGTATLFVQLLPEEVGHQLSVEERRRELETYLFGDDNEFRMSLQGVFGAFRPKCAKLKLDAAVTEFFRQKSERWSGSRKTRLNSARGKEYVRLRLKEWCS